METGKGTYAESQPRCQIADGNHIIIIYRFILLIIVPIYKAEMNNELRMAFFSKDRNHVRKQRHFYCNYLEWGICPKDWGIVEQGNEKEVFRFWG